MTDNGLDKLPEKTALGTLQNHSVPTDQRLQIDNQQAGEGMRGWHSPVC